MLKHASAVTPACQYACAIVSSYKSVNKLIELSVAALDGMLYLICHRLTAIALRAKSADGNRRTQPYVTYVALPELPRLRFPIENLPVSLCKAPAEVKQRSISPIATERPVADYGVEQMNQADHGQPVHSAACPSCHSAYARSERRDNPSPKHVFRNEHSAVYRRLFTLLSHSRQRLLSTPHTAPRCLTLIDINYTINPLGHLDNLGQIIKKGR